MSTTLLFLHQGLARTLAMYLLVCAAWGWLGVWRHQVSGSYLGALAIGEGALLIQAALGITLVITGLVPATWLHAVYGGLAAVSLPVAYGYARGRQDRTGALIFALVALWVFGLILRAFMTGPA